MKSLDHVANALCLEIVNSTNNWNHRDTDWFGTTEQLETWAESLDVHLTSVKSDDLRDIDDHRSALRKVFSAIANERIPDEQILHQIVKAAYEAGARPRLVRDGDRYSYDRPKAQSVQQLISAAAISAIDLLRFGPLDRVGECPNCGWLFLDTSKAGKRRWCDMATCGSRSKSRRYYHSRTKADSEQRAGD